MPEKIPNIKMMKKLFERWCIDSGLSGIVFVSQSPAVAIDRNRYKSEIDYSHSI